MYVEYSSVSYIEIFNQLYTGQSNTDIIKYIKKKYSEIGISWISTLGFDNSNVLICNQYCDDNNITTYSELAQSGKFKFGAPIYFYSRSDGYNLLEDKYGNSFKEAEKINLDPTLVYSALESDDIDVGLAFSTDSKLVSGNYTILEDDRQIFPKYDAGLVVNNTISKYKWRKRLYKTSIKRRK